MNTSFAELKRSRKTVYDKIVSDTNKMQSGGGGGADTRFWQPEVDKAGNGYAVSDFFPPLRVRIFLGYVCSLMVSKDQVAGTLRTR